MKNASVIRRHFEDFLTAENDIVEKTVHVRVGTDKIIIVIPNACKSGVCSRILSRSNQAMLIDEGLVNKRRSYSEVRMRRSPAIWKCILVFCILLFLPLHSAFASEDDLCLETIGGFGGIHIYTTYAFIGVTADSFSKNVYDATRVKGMMDDTSNMLNKMTELLTQLEKSDMVTEADKAYIGEMIEIIALLKEEAESLSAFAASKNPEDVERFALARKKAWPKIKQLFGIN